MRRLLVCADDCTLGALFIYLNYMQPEEIEIISRIIEDIRIMTI